MGRLLVPATMVAALLAFAVGAAGAGLTPYRPVWWPAALGLLVVGVGLGATFAIAPELGARLRQTHAELNLFGWTGLLVTGFGYYLAPRFAGRPLRWTVLVRPQLGALVGGVALSAGVLWWRAYGDGPAALVALGNGLVALAFALLALILAGTFRSSPGPARPAALTIYQPARASPSGPLKIAR